MAMIIHLFWLFSAIVLTSSAQRYYDCQAIYDDGQTKTGTYQIWPFHASIPYSVTCDMNMTNDHGWTVIQRRIDGSVDFHRDFASYKLGFGDVIGEHWLGNDKIRHLTTGNGDPDKTYILRMELTDWYGSAAFAEYSGFRMGEAFDSYPLIIGSFRGGSAGDSLTPHNGTMFLTHDVNNGGSLYAELYTGGWWFLECPASNLNGRYYAEDNGNYNLTYQNGILWDTWQGPFVSYKSVTMKVRPEIPLANVIQTSPDNESSNTEMASLWEPVYCVQQRSQDCQDVADSGNSIDGVYEVWPEGFEAPTSVWCEFDKDHGWLVILRRQDGSVDFGKTWNEYKDGFGDVEGEYWFGNEAIHLLTNGPRVYELRVDLTDLDYNDAYVEYSTFSIKNESDNYRMRLGTFLGAVGGADDESLDYHRDMQFSTLDRDNDLNSSENCATKYEGDGGYWYNNCYRSLLTGRYTLRVVWRYSGVYREHGYAAMKLRPVLE